VIVLSGPSCSGKSTLARAIQAALPVPAMYVGLDYFEAMQPVIDGRRLNLFYGQRRQPKDDPASWGPDLVPGMHACVRSFAGAGAKVVLEHIFTKRRWLKDAVAQLAGLPVLFVGVTCPLELLEAREAARRGALAGPGQAVRHARILACLDAHHPYDLVVDTGSTTPEEGARLVLRRLEEGPPFAAFRRLRDSPVLDEPDPDVG
jgi:chloramphenicol 3-O phosphotransferase